MTTFTGGIEAQKIIFRDLNLSKTWSFSRHVLMHKKKHILSKLLIGHGSIDRYIQIM